MTLEEEWDSVINNNTAIYIYGAGKIGREIFRLIVMSHHREKVKGFLVTQFAENPNEIEGIPVMLPENISDRSNLVLVAVTEKYQAAIMETLRKTGFLNIQIAHKYSILLNMKFDKLPEMIEVDVKELLLCQYEKKQFCRYDIIVELLAIENCYNKNNFGFFLYKKYLNKDGCYENHTAMTEKRLDSTIRDCEEKGYREELVLSVDRKLHFADEPGKVAFAIYFGIPRVKLKVLPIIEKTCFGREWLCKIYSEKEIQLIENKLYKEWLKWKQPIKGILWPCAAEYYDEIIQKIREEYVVSNIHDYTFELWEFEQIVHKIYEIGCTPEWKIKTKLKHMQYCMPYNIRIFDVNFDNPEFRIRIGGGILSDKGAKLKKNIRELYMGKIQEYFPDIIIHTADDFYQSRYIDSLL